MKWKSRPLAAVAFAILTCGRENEYLFFFSFFSLTNLVLAIHPHGEDHVGVGEEELHLVQRLLGLAVRPSSKFIASNAGTLLIYQSYCKVPHGLRIGIFVSTQVCLFLFVLLSLFPVFRNLGPTL